MTWKKDAGELKLTASEWSVLTCLWENSPRTVMQLVAALGERVGWAKSTTITTLRRMEDKGLVLCTVEGRARHYTPTSSGTGPSGGRPAPSWTRSTGGAWG